MIESRYIQNAKTASGINVAAGIWLVLSPLILSFSGQGSAVLNAIIFGFAIAIASLIRVNSPVKSVWASWLNMVFGAWLIISPLFLSAIGTAAIWNNLIIGLLVIIMAIVSTTAVHHERHAM